MVRRSKDLEILICFSLIYRSANGWKRHQKRCADEKVINARFLILILIIIIIVVKKVVNFVKTTGAKIVKFGLKVAESVLALGAKVVGFIPGIGKPLGKVIDGVSKVAGVIGGKIHTALSHPLETGMKVMKKALGAMKYIPR